MKSAMLASALALIVTMQFMVVDPVIAGEAPELFKRPKQLDEFALTDQDGRPFGLDRLQGHWSLVQIGYTSCPDVCPFTLANLKAVVVKLSTSVAAENVPQIVFLAVDPGRDAAALKQFVEHFGSPVVGITGGKQQIDKLVEDLGGFYRFDKGDGRGDYAVVHSSAVAVLNPQARMVAKIYPPFKIQDTALTLLELERGLALN
jgi:protein SCO1/2